MMLVNIGFGNVIAARRVIAVVSPGSLPIKKMREEAKSRGKLIDATEGRKTRSIIITDSDHVVLSALLVETIAQRVSNPLGGAAESGNAEKEG
jgi:extracellular matrix regulatory protein A